MLIDTVRAGKDAFVEKPLSARLEDAIAAHDAVISEADRAGRHAAPQRSRGSARPRSTSARARWADLQDRDGVEPQRAELARPVDMIKKEDVDWEQYQMYLPKRAFDPVRYRCWHWFYEHTTGLVGLLGSHMIDVALWFMDDPFPVSAVALGGILTWKDGRRSATRRSTSSSSRRAGC